MIKLYKRPNKQLEKLLAYENANQEFQRAIATIRKTGTITNYLKAYHNLGSKTQKIQMLVETMAADFKKENKRCFTCRNKNHLKRDCLKKANKKPPKTCPRCHKKIHWAKDYKSKFDIDEKPIPKTPNRRRAPLPPHVPYNKNQRQILSFPSNPQHLTVLLSIYQP